MMLCFSAAIDYGKRDSGHIQEWGYGHVQERGHGHVQERGYIWSCSGEGLYMVMFRRGAMVMFRTQVMIL